MNTQIINKFQQANNLKYPKVSGRYYPEHIHLIEQYAVTKNEVYEDWVKLKILHIMLNLKNP